MARWTFLSFAAALVAQTFVPIVSGKGQFIDIDGVLGGVEESLPIRLENIVRPAKSAAAGQLRVTENPGVCGKCCFEVVVVAKI